MNLARILGLSLPLASALLLVACGGGGADPSCTSDRGTLEGVVREGGVDGNPPAANADIELRRAEGDTPLHARTDAQGHYSVELPPGDWTVDVLTAEECSAESVTTTVEACETVTVDLLADSCAG